MLTADIDPDFDRVFPEVCAQIGCKPIDLLAVIMSESQGRPSALNPNGGASGLIQWMPATLRAQGVKDDAAFRRLSASQQAQYIPAYFAPWQRAGAPWTSAARLYQCVFLPATLGTAKEPGDVLCERAGRLGFAYEANAVFDVNGDKRITLDELTHAVMNAASGPRFLEMCKRLNLDTSELQGRDRDANGKPIFRSISDVQNAINAIGVQDAGQTIELTVDGLMGPRTRAAIRAFQDAHGLHVDGIAGPETREALANLLA